MASPAPWKLSSARPMRVIASLKDVVVAPENPAALIAAMRQPSVKIVSMTVTEKGYCHDPATGELNETHQDIQHDLANPATRVSPPDSGFEEVSPCGFKVNATAMSNNTPATARARGCRTTDL